MSSRTDDKNLPAPPQQEKVRPQSAAIYKKQIGTANTMKSKADQENAYYGAHGSEPTGSTSSIKRDESHGSRRREPKIMSTNISL